MRGAVTEGRVEKARRLLAENRALLDKVAAEYGVQPRFLVSFWGLESNFGEYTGGYSVIAALATLAHEGRRHDFFRAQLFDALKILDEGHIAARSEEHTSELQSLMRISYAVFCLKKKNDNT